MDVKEYCRQLLPPQIYDGAFVVLEQSILRGDLVPKEEVEMLKKTKWREGLIFEQEQRISELEKENQDLKRMLSQDVSTREQHWSTQAELYRLRNVELEKEVAETRTVLEAWQSVFGTTQLSHAQSRLESAESKLSSSIPMTALLTLGEQTEIIRKNQDMIKRAEMGWMLDLAKALVQAQQAKIAEDMKKGAGR